MSLLAAQSWRSNGDLIADVAQLYFKPTDVIVDATYGKGKWWTRYHHDPRRFVGFVWKHDPDVIALPPFGIIPIDTFHELPLEDASADVVCFDPPYVSTGGRKTSTIPDFNNRYGLTETARTPYQLHVDNMRGFHDCVRVTKPGGLILVKCQAYISSGKLQNGVYWLMSDAELYPVELVDWLIMAGHTRAQPAGRRQVHFRQNASHLLIYRKAKT